MRICLVVHGFPPVERTGVENYTHGLCRALVRAGHRVEVFVPRRDPELADLALRREEHDGFAVNWITNNQAPGNPREALLVPQLKGAFASFLDRERPEVVHFQHLIKLGLELCQVARERGLPTLYTAHDYYPICHRYTLLRPDLTRCEARGDARACARCDLAVAHLNAQPDLGDYHAGALAEQLSPAAYAALQGILADQPEAHGIERASLAALTEQRAELDRLRAEAYRGFDLVLAPSRHLIEELVRGGFERERIQHQPYGFDNADLAELPPVRRDRTKPVRFAFVGGLSKHKGVHVLLDAFARLRGRAELSVWGGSSDRAYVQRVRERCGEVGAELRGPFERLDLAGILAEVDALVVPSIWVENYPLVIHEGFSAGRPVLASRLGALPESVRDGKDGLLFEPGDAGDLARVLARCIDEPELLPALARGIRPVKSMDQEARELVARYEALRSTRRAGQVPAALPASLTAAFERFEELSALPARELFVRVLSGLDDLRESWAGELGGIEAVELLAIGLGQGSEAQDRLREAKNEIAWLRTKKEEFEEGREELMTLFEDLDRVLNETRAGSRRQAEELESVGASERRKEAEVQAAHTRLRELEDVIAEKNRHIQEVERQLRDAGRYIQRKDQEYLDLEEELRAAGEFVRLKEGELRQVAESVGLKQQELERAGQATRAQADALRRADELAKTQAEALRRAEEATLTTEAERDAARARQRAFEAGARSVAQVGALGLHAQTQVLGRALLPMLARLHALNAPDTPFHPPSDGSSFGELVRQLAALRDAMEGLVDELAWRRSMEPELDWRRREMNKVLASYQRLPLQALFARTRLGRKLSSWSVVPDGSLKERGP